MTTDNDTTKAMIERLDDWEASVLAANPDIIRPVFDKDIVYFGNTDSHAVFMRPRMPSKAQGRRGTRKAWRRQYPPGVYMLTSISHNGVLVDQYYDRW